MKFFLLALLVAGVAAAPAPVDDNQAVELIVNGVPEGQALELGDIVDIKVKEHVNGQLTASSDLLHPFSAAGLAEAAAAEAIAIVPTPVHIVEGPKPVDVLVPSPVIVASAAEAIVPTPVHIVEGPKPSPVIVAAASEVAPAPVVLPTPVQPVLIPSVVLPNPAPSNPEVIPAPVVLPNPVHPVIPSVVMPVAPEADPIHVVLPSPIQPVIISPIVPEANPSPAVLPQPAAQVSNEIFNDGNVQVQVNTDAGILSTLSSWFNLVVNYFNKDDLELTHTIV